MKNKLDEYRLENFLGFPNSEKTFLVEEGVQVSYSKFDEKCKVISSGLRLLGVSNNFKVALLINDAKSFIELVCALWKIGASVVPINPSFTGSEIDRCIQIVQPDLIIKSDELDFVSNEKVVLQSVISKTNSLDDYESSISINDPAVYMFTSGSSSEPKCVEITFANLKSSIESLNHKIGLTSSDRWLLSLPYYHIGGFQIIIRALLNEAAVVIQNKLNTENIIRSIEDNSVTHLSLVATQFKRIIDRLEKPNSSLKHVFLGGGAVAQDLRMKAVKNNWPIDIVYGSTETSAMITLLEKKFIPSKPNAAGFPMPGVEIKVVDEFGNNSPIGETGEIVVETNSIAKGYLNQKSERFSSNKYYTGDLGILDDDGCLFIKGRKDDIIISGGKKIDPAEVKICIDALPYVSESYLFKVESKEWGEELNCVLVLKENLSTDLEEKIKSDLKLKISPYKIPKKFFQLEYIPRNSLNKIDITKIKNLLSI